MVVYILIRQGRVTFNYISETEIIGVYETREDAENMQKILGENSSRELIIEEWNVE